MAQLILVGSNHLMTKSRHESPVTETTRQWCRRVRLNFLELRFVKTGLRQAGTNNKRRAHLRALYPATLIEWEVALDGRVISKDTMLEVDLDLHYHIFGSEPTPSLVKLIDFDWDGSYQWPRA
jgi:hypothetical protein